jgi:hypothetical protein
MPENCQVFIPVLAVSVKIASAFMLDETPINSNANEIQGGSHGR